MNIYIYTYIYIYIYIKRCVEKKRSLVCHNKVAKYLLNSTSLKKIQKQPQEVKKQLPKVFCKKRCS